jgi:hypothetical protein
MDNMYWIDAAGNAGLHLNPIGLVAERFAVSTFVSLVEVFSSSFFFLCRFIIGEWRGREAPVQRTQLVDGFWKNST